MRRGRGVTTVKVLLAMVGAIISLALISTAFFHWHFSGDAPLLTPRFSAGRFLSQIPEHLPWMALFALLTALVLPLRALQWQSTLSKAVPFRERYHLIAIGAFVHNTLPGKLGDLTRSFLLARTQRMPFVSVLGSVLVGKLLEFSSLMLIVALSLLGPTTATWGKFMGALRIAAVVGLGLVVFAVLVAHFAAPISVALSRGGRFPRLQHFFAHVSEGLGAARSFRGMAVGLLFSIGPVLVPSMAYGLGLEGVGIEGGLFAGALVLGAISLGQGPGIPAGTGIYYFITSWAARSLGASEEDAAAYAALTHLTTVTTLLALGAISVWLRKLRWQDLKRGSSMAAEALKHVDESPVIAVNA